MKRLFHCLLFLGLCWIQPTHAVAQTEAESAADGLQIITQSQHPKTMHSVGKGDKLSLKLDGETKWHHGRLTRIQDSTVTIDGQALSISNVVSLRTRLEWETVFAGIVVFLVAIGLGFLGYLFGRAIVQQRQHKLWEWALVILGAIGVVLFFPLLFIGSLLVWAFARQTFAIGLRYRLEVYHKPTPAVDED